MDSTVGASGPPVNPVVPPGVQPPPPGGAAGVPVPGPPAPPLPVPAAPPQPNPAASSSSSASSQTQHLDKDITSLKDKAEMMDPWLELFDFIHMWVIQSMATHKAFEAALARRLRRGDRLMMSLIGGMQFCRAVRAGSSSSGDSSRSSSSKPLAVFGGPHMDSADGHNGRKQQSQCSLLKLLTCLAVSQGDEREVEKLRGQPTSEVIELWRQLLANTCAQYKSWQRAIDNSSSAAGFKPLHQHIQQQAQEAAQQVGRTASVYDEAVLWGEWWDSCDPDDFCDLSVRGTGTRATNLPPEMLLAEHDRRLERLLLGVNVLGEPDHVTSNQRARVTSVMRVLLRLGVVNEPALRAAAAAFPEWSALMYKLRSAPSDARALQELSFASWWSRLHEQEGGAQRKQHLRQLAVEKVSGASEVQQLLLQLSSGLLQQTVGQQLYASLIPETLQKSAKPLQVMGSMLAAAASLLSRAAAAVPGPSTRAALDRTNWRVRGALAVMQREHPQAFAVLCGVRAGRILADSIFSELWGSKHFGNVNNKVSRWLVVLDTHDLRCLTPSARKTARKALVERAEALWRARQQQVQQWQARKDALYQQYVTKFPVGQQQKEQHQEAEAVLCLAWLGLAVVQHADVSTTDAAASAAAAVAAASSATAAAAAAGVAAGSSATAPGSELAKFRKFATSFRLLAEIYHLAKQVVTAAPDAAAHNCAHNSDLLLLLAEALERAAALVKQLPQQLVAEAVQPCFTDDGDDGDDDDDVGDGECTPAANSGQQKRRKAEHGGAGAADGATGKPLVPAGSGKQRKKQPADAAAAAAAGGGGRAARLAATSTAAAAVRKVQRESAPAAPSLPRQQQQQTGSAGGEPVDAAWWLAMPPEIQQEYLNEGVQPPPAAARRQSAPRSVGAAAAAAGGDMSLLGDDDDVEVEADDDSDEAEDDYWG